MTPQLRFPEFTDEWKIERLGQIVSFHRGGALSKDQLDNNGQYKAIHYGELFTKYNEVIKEARSKTNTNTGKISESGDLLMPTSDVTPEGLAKASAIYESGVMLGGDINVLRPNRLIDSTYLSYLINSQKKKVMRLVTGTTVRHVYASDIAKIYYGYPSLDEQQKIADFLTAVDDKISALEQKVEKLEIYKRVLTDKVLSRQAHLIKDTESKQSNWKNIKLGDLLIYTRNGLTMDQNLQKNGYKVTRIETISDRTINTDRVGYVSTSSDIEEYRLQVGDILFSNINSPSQIGKVVYVDKDYDLYHGMNLLRLKPNTKTVYPKYLFYVLNSIKYRQYFERICNKAVNQASINQTDLQKTDIPIPSIEEQQEIADFLSAIHQKVTLTTGQLEKTKEFKKGLLQRMFV